MSDARAGIADVVTRERKRLLGFIRQRVANAGDAEDILQDVFFEFVRACSLPEPIEQVGAWLVRVARNRIVDRYRKKREDSLDARASPDGEAVDDDVHLDLMLPAPDGGPEADYARARLMEAISEALDELPVNEREVFVAHELDGASFKELAERRGVNLNTLLGWKRRAVLHLRSRLQPLYDELL